MIIDAEEERKSAEHSITSILHLLPVQSEEIKFNQHQYYQQASFYTQKIFI